MDAERLLGSLLTSGMRGPARRVDRAAIGLGVLGVAIAAFEHFSQQQIQREGEPSNPGPFPTGGVPPPLPTVNATGSAPPPLPEADLVAAQQRALLLVRAMAAAAWADGHLDEEERGRILERLAASGLTGEERGFVAHALEGPLAPEELVAQVNDPQLAEEFYTASLLAIRIDSDAEREYLRRLAVGLHLASDQTTRLHRLIGAPSL